MVPTKTVNVSEHLAGPEDLRGCTWSCGRRSSPLPGKTRASLLSLSPGAGAPGRDENGPHWRGRCWAAPGSPASPSQGPRAISPQSGANGSRNPQPPSSCHSPVKSMSEENLRQKQGAARSQAQGLTESGLWALLPFSLQVVSDSLRPRGLQPARRLCPCDPQAGHWSALPVPPPGDLPDPGIEPGSPALAGSLPLSHLGNPTYGHSVM